MKVIRTIYEHWRYPVQNDEDGDCKLFRYKRNFKTFIPSGKGGLTVCRLILDEEIEGSNEIVESAWCNPSNNFNYRLGRTIAYGRAMKEFRKLYQTNLKQQFDALPFAQNEATGAAVL